MDWELVEIGLLVLAAIGSVVGGLAEWRRASGREGELATRIAVLEERVGAIPEPDSTREIEAELRLHAFKLRMILDWFGITDKSVQKDDE